MIPDYRKQICSHYGLNSVDALASLCREVDIDMPFEHFGIAISFHDACELALFGKEGVLDAGMQLLIAEFGLVVLHNACLDPLGRSVEHRARFKHLSFHRDRDPGQASRFSLYSRSPYCEEQREPRESSTLFMANIVAHLQMRKEQPTVKQQPGVRAHYELFETEGVKSCIGSIVAEHAWNDPAGVGELSMLDNRTALHSSYYQNTSKRSYRIGVRYLE